MSHGNTLLGSVRKVSSTGHRTILSSAVALLPNPGTVQLETAPRRTTREEKRAESSSSESKSRTSQLGPDLSRTIGLRLGLGYGVVGMALGIGV